MWLNTRRVPKRIPVLSGRTHTRQDSSVDDGAFRRGLWLGALLGLGVASVVATVTYFTHWRVHAQERIDRPREAAVVLNVDLDAGAELTASNLALLSMPPICFRPSVVAAHQAHAVFGKRLMMGGAAGDLLLWSHLEPEGRDGGP